MQRTDDFRGRRSAPTGFRHITANSLAAQKLAERFEGLPESLTRSQVLSMFKRAAPELGVAPQLVAFIDFLMGFSPDQDWLEGAVPIVWPSNAFIMDEFQVSRSTAKRLIRAAADAGLISIKDSPNGKRYGYRAEGRQNARILFAYGFDLSPLAVRYQEFSEAVEQKTARREALRADRRALTVAYRRIVECIELGREMDLDDAWEDIFEESHNLYQRGRDCLSVDLVRPYLKALQLRRDDLETRLMAAVLERESDQQSEDEDVSMNPLGITDGPHNTTTTDLSSDKSDYIRQTRPNGRSKSADSDRPNGRNGRIRMASKESLGASSEPSSQKTGLAEADFLPGEAFSPKQLVEISAGMAMMLPDGPLTWASVLEAAFKVKGAMGISQHAWGEACQKLGRERAAACIAIIDAKRASIDSPGGYLRGMTERGTEGELKLSNSIYMLVKAKNRKE